MNCFSSSDQPQKIVLAPIVCKLSASCAIGTISVFYLCAQFSMSVLFFMKLLSSNFFIEVPLPQLEFLLRILFWPLMVIVPMCLLFYCIIILIIIIIIIIIVIMIIIVVVVVVIHIIYFLVFTKAWRLKMLKVLDASNQGLIQVTSRLPDFFNFLPEFKKIMCNFASAIFDML